MLICQKPYGVDFKAYRYSPETKDFDHVPDYALQRADSYVDP
jgi:6-phosphofructo-2-kinase